MYADIGMESARLRSMILHRTTEADEQVMVVGIDDGGSTREIGRVVIDRSASANLHGCVLWLDAARVAWRTRSRSLPE